MQHELRSDLASLQMDRSAVASGPSFLKRLVTTIATLGLLAAVGVGAIAIYRRVQPSMHVAEVQTTTIGMISPSQAEVQLTATGYVVPQHTSKVGAKVEGRVAKLFVKEGDLVKEGAPLVQLDDINQRTEQAQQSTRVGSAQARVTTAQANLADITQQVARTQALAKTGAVGQAQLEDLLAKQVALKAQVKAAEMEVVAARADVNVVSVGLKDRMITAPMAGRIVTKPVGVGEIVGPTTAAIAEIVDFTTLVVEVDVPEARLLNVNVGGPCEIVLDAYPNQRYRGEVLELGTRVNRAKGTLPVKVKFIDDLKGVLPEMSARVSMLSKAITDATLNEAPKRTVAPSAVVTREGQQQVFVIEEGKLRAYPVRIGSPVGSSVELVDGPAAGTKILAHPTAANVDGEPIKESGK